jgi:hypothetical protein
MGAVAMRRATLIPVLFVVAVTAVAPPAGAQDAPIVGDALTSRLFVGPTGRSLERGEGYFSVDSIFLPVFQIGVTDRFSIGAGAPLWGVVGAGYVTPKLQVYRGDRTQVAAGAVHFVSPAFLGFTGFGYAVATHGSADASVTTGVAMLYGAEGSGASKPMFLIGGDRRVGRRSKVVTENYILPGAVITTLGWRRLGNRFTSEVGVMASFAGEFVSRPAPFFNLVWHGRAR